MGQHERTIKLTHKKAVKIVESILSRVFIDYNRDIRELAEVCKYILKTVPKSGDDVDL